MKTCEEKVNFSFSSLPQKWMTKCARLKKQKRVSRFSFLFFSCESADQLIWNEMQRVTIWTSSNSRRMSSTVSAARLDSEEHWKKTTFTFLLGRINKSLFISISHTFLTERIGLGRGQRQITSNGERKTETHYIFSGTFFPFLIFSTLSLFHYVMVRRFSPSLMQPFMASRLLAFKKKL